MIVKDFALQLCSQMSEDDRQTFTRDKWREGVALNIAASDGRYAALDVDDVLDEMGKLIAWYVAD